MKLPAATFLFLISVLGLLALELGWRTRREHHEPSLAAVPLLLAVLLLQLLGVGWELGEQRQRVLLVHEESDAVAQCYRRSTLFPDLDRRWYRSQLVSFLEVELSDLSPGTVASADPVEARIHPIFLALTQHTVQMELPQHYELRREQMMSQVSQLISLHYRMRYALRERTPRELWACFIVAFLVGAVLVGRLQRQREFVVWLSYLVLSVALLGMMTDLDDPLNGSIQARFDNLRELRVALLKEPT